MRSRCGRTGSGIRAASVTRFARRSMACSTGCSRAARSAGFGRSGLVRLPMTANYLIWLIVSPSQLILIAALLAAVFWRRPAGRKLAGMTVALVLLFGVAPLGGLLIKPLETRFEIPAALSRVDGIIVLSGSEQVALSELYSQPQINAAGDRLTTFLALAVAHPEARLVYTGGTQTKAARGL